MKILLYANGSSENHGCEAIKKTVIKILGEHEYFIGTTNHRTEKEEERIEYIPYSFQKKYSIFERALKRLNLIKKAKGKLKLQQFESYFKDCDIAISVGGDNYCYEDSDWLYYLHDMALKVGKKTILLGASIEEKLIDEYMLKDFNKFDRIIVRETVSYDSLKKYKLDNVYLCPDPAFALPTTKPDTLNEGVNLQRKYIGINISPLVVRKEVEPGLVRENVKMLIDYILQNTDYDVMLIPHVVTIDNNDYELLSEYKELYPSERVVLISDQSCDILKYYIAQCDLFVAARTHASIAAYSECVPTLVIGYSVKSRGIARDLFGTEQDYVLPIEFIRKNDSLLNGFKWLYNHSVDIQNCLQKTMSGYIKETDKIRQLVFGLCNEE